MKFLIILAHPERNSLNGALVNVAAEALEAAGHSVEVSDLYAQKWKAVIDHDDYEHAKEERLFVLKASREQFDNDRVPEDILAEQKKLLEADAVIFQFPFWWFGMPAILKGWFDRVYSHKFGYGTGVHSNTQWDKRYGEGKLLGKRAMLSVTTGGWVEHYQERAINGPIEHLLFPINHGNLFYAGFEVLPPFVVHKADGLKEEGFAQVEAAYRERLANFFSDAPIPYRVQNAGDYDIPSLHLKAGLERGDEGSPYDLHLKS